MSRYNNYNWEGVRYGKGRKTPTADPLTKWLIIALLLAIVSHIVVLVAMKKMPIFFQSNASEEIITQSVVVRNVEDQRYIETPRENIPETVSPPSESADVLIEELEMLEESPEDIELDFSATIDSPEISVPMEAPAISGDFESSALDFTAGIDISEVVEDLGSTTDFLKPAIGQITVDPGKQIANEFDPDLFNVELAKGAGGEVKEGVLEGFTPLSEMTRLSQSDLIQAKGMIGSDLLFEFNQSTLRESAKNSLLKVVLLIDKNPNMKCWIEGHTDLIGSEEANVELSIARAEAVKHWLVHSMKISESRLFVRGLGESNPIVMQGNQNEQAINRRVEIKMRNEEPPKIAKEVIRKPRVIKPLRNPNLEANIDTTRDLLDEEPSNLRPLPPVDLGPESNIKPPTPAPKAVPVEDASEVPEQIPARAVPVETEKTEESRIPARAIPIEENPVSEPQPLKNDKIPPKAIPVE